jgi:hypothetical protein
VSDGRALIAHDDVVRQFRQLASTVQLQTDRAASDAGRASIPQATARNARPAGHP